MRFGKMIFRAAVPMIFMLMLLPAGAKDSEGLKPGDKVPPFSFFDSDGERIKLSDLAGNTPVVLSFFGTFCLPCQKEIPFLLSQSKNGKVFKLVLVATDTGVDSLILDYLKKAKVKHPYIYDPNGEVIRDFYVKELPHSVFIGKSGAIVSVEKGYTPKKNKDLINLIKTLADK